MVLHLSQKVSHISENVKKQLKKYALPLLLVLSYSAVKNKDMLTGFSTPHATCQGALEGDPKTMDLSGLDTYIDGVVKENKYRVSNRSCDGLQEKSKYRDYNLKWSDVINADDGAIDYGNAVINGGLDDEYNLSGDISVLEGVDFDDSTLPAQLGLDLENLKSELKTLDFQDVTSSTYRKNGYAKNIMKYLMYHGVNNGVHGVKISMPIKSGFVEGNPNRLGQQLGSFDKEKREQLEGLLEGIDSYQDIPDGMLNVFLGTGAFSISLINAGNDAQVSLEINELDDVQALINAIAVHERLHDFPDLGHVGDNTSEGGVMAPGFSISTRNAYYEQNQEHLVPAQNAQIVDKLLDEHGFLEVVTSNSISYAVEQEVYENNRGLIDSLELDQEAVSLDIGLQLSFTDCAGEEITNLVDIDVVSNTAPVSIDKTGSEIFVSPEGVGSGELTIVATFDGDTDGSVSNTETFTYPINVKQTVSTVDDQFDANISIFPNPTADYVTIEMSENANQIVRDLVSSEGVKVLDGSDMKIDMSSYASGAYFLLLRDETTGARSTQRIIKQ